jgi:hypothetical protein
MSSDKNAPFQSPSNDIDPALILLNLRKDDTTETGTELRRTQSRSSSYQTAQQAMVRI